MNLSKGRSSGAQIALINRCLPIGRRSTALYKLLNSLPQIKIID